MGYYEVPGMTPIAEKMTVSWWYASAPMPIQWKQDQFRQSLAWLVPPELDAQCALIRVTPASRIRRSCPWPSASACAAFRQPGMPLEHRFPRVTRAGTWKLCSYTCPAKATGSPRALP